MAERFHLALALLFVVVEEMDNAGSSRPNAALLQRCAGIFAAEVAIDVTKHAVVTKFSDVRPGVYRTFLHVRCLLQRLGCGLLHRASDDCRKGHWIVCHLMGS